MSDEKKGETENINLKVLGQDNAFVQFKINTPLRKHINAYCDRAGLSMQVVRFRFDGQPINENDTTTSLEMEEGELLKYTNSKRAEAGINSEFNKSCGSVVPSADYNYNPAYSQYGSTYGSYGYCTSTGLLNSPFFYEGGQSQTSAVLNQDIRSSAATTSSISLASDSLSTGNACPKQETSDLFLV